MLPDLEIRVLFCYSPEVLEKTYYNKANLVQDNDELCCITEDIFKANVTTYNVSITKVADTEIKTLQYQWGTTVAELSDIQLQRLVMSTTPTGYIYSCFNRLQFGTLPQKLLELKEVWGATVVVLETLLNNDCETADGVMGVSSLIGINNPEEAFVGLGRQRITKKQATSFLTPTTLAHELGHLMGCKHPKGDESYGCDNTDGNSHGHYLYDLYGNVVAGTIMSYYDDPIWYYSNPTLYRYPAEYQDKPCGKFGESEAYKTVNNNIQKLAGIF